MNPVLAPRVSRCLICASVADLSDVAIRLWDEGAERIPAGTWRVAEYLESIGVEGTKRALEARAQTHRKHVEEFLARPSQAVAPMQLIPGGKGGAASGSGDADSPAGVTRLPPARTGPARWVDTQQHAMDVGTDALRLLAGRLETMENADLISVAKLGATTAGKRADLEAKGRRINQVDALIRMAAGLSGPKELEPPVDVDAP